MAPDLSIIVVAYNCSKELADCLASLRPEVGGPTREFLVVDNASRDGTAQMVRERFAWVRLIANDRNRGFAAANNQGLAIASGRHILFLNPDTVVHDDALAVLVRTLEGDASLGACGPQLLNADGSIQPSVRRFPTFAALAHQYTPLRALRVLKGAYRRYKMADFNFTTAADVDVLMGAAICVPAGVLAEVGVFDERFFVYFEEMDLCRRIHDAGRRIRFEPAARITHVGGVSAATATANLFFCRSLLKYIRKHNGCLKAFAMIAMLWPGMFLREAILLVTNLVAALALAIAGRAERSVRRLARAKSAARFVCCDGWRAFLKG
jgi:hypothetical protein